MGDCKDTIVVDGVTLTCGGHEAWDNGKLHFQAAWIGTRRIEIHWLTEIDTDKVEG